MMWDRRRYARVEAALDVTVEVRGGRCKGKTLKLSLYGMKVASPVPSVPLSPGTSVHVWLYPDDRNPPLCLPASVVRTDPDGLALSFENVGPREFRRLKDLVDSFLLREWQASLNDNQAVPRTDGHRKGLLRQVREFIGLIHSRRPA